MLPLFRENESEQPQRPRRCQTRCSLCYDPFACEPHRCDGSEAARRGLMQGLGLGCTVHRVLCIVSRALFTYVSWSICLYHFFHKFLFFFLFLRCPLFFYSFLFLFSLTMPRALSCLHIVLTVFVSWPVSRVRWTASCILLGEGTHL